MCVGVFITNCATAQSPSHARAPRDEPTHTFARTNRTALLGTSSLVRSRTLPLLLLANIHTLCCVCERELLVKYYVDKMAASSPCLSFQAAMPLCAASPNAFEAVAASSCSERSSKSPLACWALRRGGGDSHHASSSSPPTSAQPRDFYFMGNSVTRHYMFALKEALEASSSSSSSSSSGIGGIGRGSRTNKSASATTLSRQEEKQICHGVDGKFSTCKLFARHISGRPTALTYMWKHTIDAHAHTRDDPRDACQPWARRGESVAACLTALFRNATSADVLVVGSMLANLTEFYADGGSTFDASLPRTSLKIARSLAVASSALSSSAGLGGGDGDAVALLLRCAFPGTIVWHSFAHVDMAPSKWRSERSAWDVNPCLEYVDEAARCALDGGRRRRHFEHDAAIPLDVCPHLKDKGVGNQTHTAAFLSVRMLQESNHQSYVDMIHHPGLLAQRIVRALLETLRVVSSHL